jgi:hypothetical protein
VYYLTHHRYKKERDRTSNGDWVESERGFSVFSLKNEWRMTDKGQETNYNNLKECPSMWAGGGA